MNNDEKIAELSRLVAECKRTEDAAEQADKAYGDEFSRRAHLEGLKNALQAAWGVHGEARKALLDFVMKITP